MDPEPLLPESPDVDIVKAVPITIMVYPGRHDPSFLAVITHWWPNTPIQLVISALEHATQVARDQQQALQARGQNGQVNEPPPG